MKQYRHKKLGWIVNQVKNIEGKFIGYEYDNYFIPKELIENSDDWEEIIQEDWIDKVEKYWNIYSNRSKTKFREVVEEYMPKVSEEELKEINKSHGRDENGRLIFHIDKQELIELLKSKGLLKDK